MLSSLTSNALHSDAAVNDERKIVAVYFPRSEPAWRPGDGGRCEFLLNSLTHDGAHLKFKRSVIDDDFCKLQIGV